MRLTLIEVNNVLQPLDISKEIKLLLFTAVKISECLYASNEERSPKKVLQLHNACWLHHELCKVIFVSPKRMTYEKFFGLYLHSLVVHAPRQYEIVCLRSVNAESQERLFQQAKQIASNCTNRKPENVLPSVLIRLQAKQITGKMSNLYHSTQSRVKNAAMTTPSKSGTEIDKSFIADTCKWQAHLKCISSYLVISNVWWQSTPTGYIFFQWRQ